jgi:hypothetical protein
MPPEMKNAASISRSGVVFLNEALPLDLRDGYSLLVTDLNAALAAQTFLCVDRHRFTILHLINIHGTNLYTFFTSFTFIRIDDYFIPHMIFPPVL